MWVAFRIPTIFFSYFEKMNDSTSLLDPKLYTPPLTAVRSPFLFTVSECCQF